MTSYIKLIRSEYEEPTATHITFIMYTQGHMLTGEMYANRDSVIELSKVFIGYPSKNGELRKFEIGSEDPRKRWDCHLLIEMRQIDKTGRCGVSLRWSNNREFPYRKLHEFTIEAEPYGLNELGLGISAFANMQHEELYWNGKDVKLLEKSAQQGGADGARDL